MIEIHCCQDFLPMKCKTDKSFLLAGGNEISPFATHQ